MSDHDRVSELLAVYALDAVSHDESLLVELHVAHCEICQSELDQHFETAGALGTVVESPPEDLWSRIATQLPSSEPAGALATVTDIRRAPRRNRATTPEWFAAAAAAAAVVVLAVSLNSANSNLSRMRSQALASGFAQSWNAALAAPGHHSVTLRTPNGAQVAKVVIAPTGAAYLSSHAMAALASDRTYQLWAVSTSGAVSIGLMGSHPTNVSFAVGKLLPGETIAVTEEPESGSVAPSSTPVASGVIRA